MISRYSKIYRDGISIGVSCESEAAWRELQARFESLTRRCLLELPEGVQILSVSLDAEPRVGVISKNLHSHQFCMPDGGFPDRLSRDTA